MREEWAKAWKIPVIGLLGMTGPAAFSFCSGVFMEDITREFGWTRAEYASALLLQMLVAIAVGPFGGRLLDKIGPRKMVLGGIVPFASAFSLFAFLDGSIALWWALSLAVGVLAFSIGPPNWVAGAVRSFDASRGLAIGTVLAGTGLASAIWPVVAVFAAGEFGWRMAFPIIGLGWGLIMLPLVYLFFRPLNSAQDAKADNGAADASVHDARASQVFLDPVYWALFGAGCLFVTMNMSIILTFIPILRSHGLDMHSAAAVAGIVGVFSVLGRLVTGFLVDRLPLRGLVLIAFSLPFVVLTLLLTGGGNQVGLIIAAAFLGFGAGAETDIVSYLCSRRFDRALFGTAFATLFAGFAACAGIGPMVAGMIYDRFGSYDPFLLAGFPIIFVAVILSQLSLPKARRDEGWTERAIPDDRIVSSNSRAATGT